MPKTLEQKFYAAKQACSAFNNNLVPSAASQAAWKQYGKLANEIMKKYHAPKKWKFSNSRRNAERVLEAERNRLRGLIARNIMRHHFPPGVFQPMNIRHH